MSLPLDFLTQETKSRLELTPDVVYVRDDAERALATMVYQHFGADIVSLQVSPGDIAIVVADTGAGKACLIVGLPNDFEQAVITALRSAAATEIAAVSDTDFTTLAPPDVGDVLTAATWIETVLQPRLRLVDAEPEPMGIKRIKYAHVANQAEKDAATQVFALLGMDVTVDIGIKEDCHGLNESRVTCHGQPCMIYGLRALEKAHAWPSLLVSSVKALSQTGAPAVYLNLAGDFHSTLAGVVNMSAAEAKAKLEDEWLSLFRDGLNRESIYSICAAASNNARITIADGLAQLANVRERKAREESTARRDAEVTALIDKDVTAFTARLKIDTKLAYSDECAALIRRMQADHPEAGRQFFALLNALKVDVDQVYAAVETSRTISLESVVKALGYSFTNGVEHYHFMGRGKGVITLSKRDFGSSNITAFTTLANADFWLSNFSKLDKNDNSTGKVNGEAIGIALQNLCWTKGIWTERDQQERLRGRGSWIDTTDDGNEIAVTHYGDRLHITDTDGTLHETDLDGGRFRTRMSRCVYLARPPVPCPSVTGDITPDEATKLRSIIQRLQWQDPVSAHLFAGYIMLAPLCGALDWRTHLWIEGGAGSGKSWLINKVLVPLIPQCLNAQSDSTAAGIRQGLDSDAKPTLFDEAEGESEKTQINIRNIIELARAASSAAAKSYKGTQSGEGTTYSLYSMFAFASIGVTLSQGADASRIARLAITAPPAITVDPIGNAKAMAKFKTLQNDIHDLFTKDFAMRLQARRTKSVLRARHNCRLLKDAISAMSGNNRMADTLSLMAGDIELAFGRTLTPAEIDNYLAEATIDAHYLNDNHSVDPDHVKLINIEAQFPLTTVMQIPGVSTQFPFQERPIGQLMLDAMECGDGLTDQRVARYTLETVGFKIIDTHDPRVKLNTERHPGNRFYIAMSANINMFGRLKDLLKKSPNASQWENTAPAIIKSGFNNLLLEDRPRQLTFHGIPRQVPCYVFSPDLFVNKDTASSKLNEFAKNDNEAAA
jgi:hypothetical protein